MKEIRVQPPTNRYIVQTPEALQTVESYRCFSRPWQGNATDLTRAITPSPTNTSPGIRSFVARYGADNVAPRSIVTTRLRTMLQQLR